MKRLLSIVLTVMMLVSILPAASAITLDEAIGWMTEALELELSLDVKGRASGSTNAYASSTPLMISDSQDPDPVGVDYKATLYMDRVRAIFDKGFISEVLPADDELRTEFEAGTVTTNIDVEVTFPEGSVKGGVDLTDAATGVLKVNDSPDTIYLQKGARVIEGNTIKVSFENKDIKVSDLLANVDGTLGDVSFELVDAFEYNTVSTPEISVKFSGSTVIDFATKKQTINYTEVTSRHISTITATVTEHILEVVPVVPPTCYDDGHTEGVRCTIHGYECKEKYGVTGIVVPEVIPALGHADLEAATVIDIEGHAATCSTKGSLAHKTCILCKQDFVNGQPVSHEDLEIPADASAHNEITINGIDATCTNTGLTDGKQCAICGKITEAQEVSPALPHTEEVLPAIAATCTSPGKTEGKICSVCDKVLVRQATVPAMGHNLGDWEIVVEPTETTTGLKRRTCLNECGKVIESPVPVLQHTHVIDPEAEVIIDATCTTTGTRKHVCACGHVMDTEVIPMTPHDTTHVEGVPATCRETGIVEHWKCVVCNKTFRDEKTKKELKTVVEPINERNHDDNEVVISKIEATCEHYGFTEGKKCTACNVMTVVPKVVKMADHTYENVPSLAATCETTGIIEHLHCYVCNKDFDLKKNEKPAYVFDIPAKGHDFTGNIVVDTPKDSVNGIDGAGHIECKNGCGTKKENIVIPAGPHQHSGVTETIIVRATTCTEPGIARTLYACCGEVAEDNIAIPVRPHTPERSYKVDATCHVEGVAEYYRCSECHQIIERTSGEWEVAADQEIPVLGKKSHNWVQQSPNVKKCVHCNEVVKVNDNSEGKVDVKSHGGIKEEKDIVLEEVDNKFKVESEIKINQREEFSNKVDEKVEELPHDKAVYDIIIEKVTTREDDANYEDRELVKETEDLVTIVIDISHLSDKVSFAVYRVHDGVTEVLGDENHKVNGEYYVISADKTRITLYVRKFSEYAVVGYDEEVDTQPEEPQTPSAGGSSGYTIKFSVDGGTAVKDVKASHGQTIVAPVTTKAGYKFVGWYEDMELTKLFDFNTPIKYSMTLYAKWVANAWFVDVPENAWFYDEIKYAYDNGIMNGISDTHFAPDSALTRAMFVTVLYRIENEPDVDAPIFTDVDKDSWYGDAVAWATENGITNGVSETEFAPNTNILREQIAAMLYRYAQFKGYKVSAEGESKLLSYADAATISEYAVPAFNWAVGDGILNGKSESTLAPKDNATRAEAAALLMRIIEKYSK